MHRPGLTAVLIVRDAASWLPGCLESLNGPDAPVDEVCILDTGSVDGTPSILATSHGVRWEQGPWRNDFSEARNRALGLARTDWVLSIDADERLIVDPPRLREALEQARSACLDMLVLEVLDIRGGRRVSSARIARLLNVTTMQFRNRVHEVPARRDGSMPRGALVDAETVRLRHLGYDSPEAMLRRRNRNVSLAMLEVSDRRRAGTDPEDLVAALVSLGRSRASADHGAVEGVVDWLEAWRIDVQSPFRLWAGELAVVGLAQSGELSLASDVLSELAVVGIDERQLAWLTGRIFREAGQRADALACFRLAEGRVTAMGERPSDVPVLVARLELEVGEGAVGDAAMTAARLIGAHRQYGEVLDLFLVLTGGDPGLGARVLKRFLQPDDAGSLVTELLARGEAGIGLKDVLVESGHLATTTTAPQSSSDVRENPQEKSSCKLGGRR